MAVSSRVQAIFSANASGLTAGVKRAAASLGLMERSVLSLKNQMTLLNTLTGIQVFGGIVSAANRAASAVTNFTRSVYGEVNKAVAAAVDLGEETSKSFVIFGQAAEKIGTFADSASKIGLSEVSALQATGTFGNLFRAMGVGQEQAAEYSLTMTKLAADLASFNNSTVDDALVAVGSALRGEAEPIRRFGVLLNDATLKNEALAQNLIKNASGALPPAVKAMAAYSLILKQTAVAQGDFARTSDGLANLGRIVNAQAANMVSEVGSAFEPLFRNITATFSEILTSVGPFVSDLAAGLGGALSRVAEGIRGLAAPIGAFVSQLDGVRVGESIAAAMLDAVEYAASWADTIYGLFVGIMEGSTNSAASWTTLANVWSGIWDAAGRIFSVAQGIFYSVGTLFTGIFAFFGNIYAQILTAIDYIPGVDGTQQAEAAKAYAESLQRSTKEYMNEAGRAYGNAFGSTVAEAAESGVGPMQRTIQELRKAIVEQKQQLAEAATAAETKITDAGVKAAAAATSTTTQVAGIDARSAEGINYIIRQMTGNRTDEAIQRQQLATQRGILTATQNQQPASVAVANI